MATIKNRLSPSSAEKNLHRSDLEGFTRTKVQNWISFPIVSEMALQKCNVDFSARILG